MWRSRQWRAHGRDSPPQRWARSRWPPPLICCPAYAQKAISGDGIAQIDLRQPASFSTYTVTGDPASTDVAFIGSAFVAGTDAVTDGGSARSYVFRNRGTIRTSGTK